MARLVFTSTRRAALVAALLYAGSAHAQLSDTLREVHVKAGTNGGQPALIARFLPGQKQLVVDSTTKELYRRESVASLLAQQLPVFVRTYGTNGPSTLNLRGSSAAQTAVFWDGVPIDNAALGLADISVMPVSFSDDIRLLYGGSAAMLGGGNIGGALLLNSRPAAWSDSVVFEGEAGGSAGSFGRVGLFGSAYRRGQKHTNYIKAFYDASRNDFPYRTTNGGEGRLTNASLRWGGVQTGLSRKTRTGSFSAALWLQAADRQIPPAIFERRSTKTQQDAAARLKLDWLSERKTGTWTAKFAQLADYFTYEDSLSNLSSKLTVHKTFVEVAWNKRLRDWNLRVFAPVTLAFTPAADSGNAWQRRFALAGAVSRNLFAQQLTLAGAFRAEVVDGNFQALPGANMVYRLSGGVFLRANAQRTYRPPTLQERFYRPGGNSTLRPEQGWSFDAGAGVEGNRGILSWQGDISAYSRRIQDWILWFGGAIWTPHNIALVQSRGLEGNTNAGVLLGTWQFRVRGAFSATDARTLESSQPNDGSIGKQIPYAPRWNGRAGLGVQRGAFLADWSYAYTGVRYVTTDESFALPAYTVQSVALRYGRNLFGFAFWAAARCDNLTGAQYTIVAGRPAPGRNFVISMGFGSTH